jgi:hypothetical protein
MTGGLKKTTSGLAIATIASVVASGAFAADLGGNCCADLEERVAELEATTARKGNRKVKLTISGHVNETLIFWDDGFEQNQYVVSNNNSRTRFRFVGDAKINDRWSAGYLLEIGARYASSGNRNQTTPGGGSNSNTIDIRHSAWWIENKDLGRVWVGKTSTATNDITEINLANVNTALSGDNWIGGFFLRNANNSLSTNKWNNITPSFNGAWNEDGDRNTTVRYVSPALHGFTFSAAWGEDDYWDTSLRYAGEFNGIRIAAGIGYKQQNDNVGKTGSDGDICADLNAAVPQVSTVDCHVISGSASVMHVPTGLFLTGAYARYTDENRKALYGNIAGIKDEDTYWTLMSGIEQNWFGIGKTTLYGEYARHEVGAGLTSTGGSSCDNFGPATGSAAVPGTGVSGGLGCLSSAEVNFWGLGINQEIAAAAMDMYVAYRHFDPTVKTSADGSTTGSATAGVKEFDAVMAGAIIRF